MNTIRIELNVLDLACEGRPDYLPTTSAACLYCVRLVIGRCLELGGNYNVLPTLLDHSLVLFSRIIAEPLKQTKYGCIVMMVLRATRLKTTVNGSFFIEFIGWNNKTTVAKTTTAIANTKIIGKQVRSSFNALKNSLKVKY